MLQGINKIGRSWVGRAVVTVLFGFLIISFAIWGIGDIFRGQVRTAVATVGKQDISAEAYRSAYQTEYQNLIRRTRQTITPDQARALGLDRQVLNRLVTEAALDQEARDLKLAVSDAQVIQSIQNDPSFRGGNGQFDRAQFNDLLRSNGFSEGQYVREQRSIAARLQLSEAMTGALPVPLSLQEAVHRFQTETRSIEYFLLSSAAVGEVPVPDDAELQAFYDSHKTLYRAPEYRSFNLLTLSAGTLAKPDAVSEEDARRFYDRMSSSRFGTPEKRTLQQIVFPTQEEANAASQRIKDGATLEEVAKERGIDEATLNFGEFTRAEMFDPAIADVAFTLPEGAVSAPVAGRFGPVLVRVTKVQAGSTKPFDEVKDDVKRDLSLERARTDLQKVHDAIEDQRASAKPLKEIAAERGLTLRSVPPVDRQGFDKSGKLLSDLPEPAALLQAGFRSDIGADNEALRAGDGYVWFEVTNVEAARDRPFAEVKERVSVDWRQDQVTKRLADKAHELKARLDGGASLASVAADLGVKVETAANLRRTGPGEEPPRAVATRAFATPVGKTADVATDAGRYLLSVTGATVPPFVTTTQQAALLAEQLRQALAEDLMAEFIAVVEKQLGVTTSAENLRRAIGGET